MSDTRDGRDTTLLCPSSIHFGHDGIVSLPNDCASPNQSHSGRKSLHGRRIVITRARQQSQELAALLQDTGALPLFYPCIDIVPPEDTTALDESLRTINTFDWLVLTSANTVRILDARMEVLNLPRSLLANVQVAAVGFATAQAARELLGVEAVLPARSEDGGASQREQSPNDTFNAASLAAALPLQRGARVFLPQSEIAPAALAQALAARGADVQTVTVYRTVRGHGGDPVPRLLARRQVDVVIFTSGSTVEYFLDRLTSEQGRFSDLAGVTIACIGGSTARTARDVGLQVAVVPPVPSIPALVSSLEEYFDA